MNRRPADHRLVMFGSTFAVADAAAMLVDPGQTPFHGPPAVQHHEPNLPCEFGDDLGTDPEQGTYPVDQRAGVAGVGAPMAEAA